MTATSRLLGTLGTQYPLIQAPMAGIQGSAMAVAVSKAGRARLAALRHAHARRHPPGAASHHRRNPRQALQRQLLLPHAA